MSFEHIQFPFLRPDLALFVHLGFIRKSPFCLFDGYRKRVILRYFCFVFEQIKLQPGQVNQRVYFPIHQTRFTRKFGSIRQGVPTLSMQTFR